MSTRVCPECGSSHITGPDLTSPALSRGYLCLQCGWSGKEVELVAIPDEAVDKKLDEDGGLSSPDRGIRIASKMSEDLLNRIAKNTGQMLGLSLVQAGFVGLKDTARLARLIKAACLGAVGGVMGEMELLQTEEQNAAPKITT